MSTPILHDRRRQNVARFSSGRRGRLPKLCKAGSYGLRASISLATDLSTCRCFETQSSVMKDISASASWRFHASAKACRAPVVTSALIAGMIGSPLHCLPMASVMLPSVKGNRARRFDVSRTRSMNRRVRLTARLDPMLKLLKCALRISVPYNEFVMTKRHARA